MQGGEIVNEKDKKILEEIYTKHQECPGCGKDDFLELKKFPGYGRCMECSFDNEFEKSDEY